MSANFLPSLRSRLTVIYIVSTTLLLLIISGLFSMLLWVALHNQIDHHVHIVTTQTEKVVNNFTGEQKEMLLDNLVAMEGMSILVIDLDGRILMQKNSNDILPLDEKEVGELLEKSSRIGHHPVHFSIHGQRFGSAVMEINGRTNLIAVGYSTRILRETFVKIIAIVVGMILVSLVPLAYFGYKLLKKYLNPLEEIAKTAKEINHPKKLSSRVRQVALTDETATIVDAFNQMLVRLEQVFRSEHEFFSDAAHTLKTPLAVLRARIEGAEKLGQAKRQEMLEVIDLAIETVGDLLLMSRIEAGIGAKNERVNVSEIGKELVEIIESLAEEKSVQVRGEIEHGVWMIADSRLIKRAWGNIVDNAVQYVNIGGEIEIRLFRDEGEIIFEVNNTMSEKIGEVDKVFERFYRGENSGVNSYGSGLGLAISKAIIENHQGRITFQVYKLKKVSVTTKLPIGMKV